MDVLGALTSAFNHNVAALTVNSWPAWPVSGLTLNSNKPFPFTLYPGEETNFIKKIVTDGNRNNFR